MANMRIIGFNDRTAELRRIRLGYEGDNLVERLEFILPDIAQGQRATLLITGADAVTLDRTDEGRYAVDLTRDMIGPDGEREAYVRVDGAGGKVWQSAPMRLITGALPDIETEIEKVYPTAVGQMLTAMAEHSGEMAAQEERIKQEAQRAEDAADALNDPDVVARTLVPEGEASAEWTVVNGKPTLTLNIPRGKPGDKGDKGDKGDAPIKGIDYTDGKDGVGIADITVERAINPDNRDMWEVTFKTTDGKETSYFVADGKDGRTPVKGFDYTDGAPGPGITDLTITERTDAAGRRYHQIVIMWEEALNGSIIKAGQSFNVYDGADGEPGKSGVYVGPDEPTDPEVDVWINPEGEGEYIDKTLTQAGRAADANATGERIAEMGKATDKNGGNAAEAWEQGTIDDTTGKLPNSTRRLRTVGYIPAATVRVNTDTNYSFKVFAYGADDSYAGTWNGSAFATSGSVWLTEFDFAQMAGLGYRYRLILRRNNDAVVTPDSYVYIHFTNAVFAEIEAVRAECNAKTDELFGAVAGDLNEPSLWVKGGITGSGAEYSAMNVIRTRSYIPDDVKLVYADGNWHFMAFLYDETGTFVGCWGRTGIIQTANEWLLYLQPEHLSGYKIRLMAARIDGAAITADNAMDGIRFLNDIRAKAFYPTPTLTFIDDDGSKNALENWESITDEIGIKITSALVTGVMGDDAANPQKASWADVARLQNKGYEFVSHTHNHINIPDCTDDVVIEQFESSIAALREHGCEARYLVYPYNAIDAAKMPLVKKYFKAAVGLGWEIDNVLPIQTYDLKRYSINSDEFVEREYNGATVQAHAFKTLEQLKSYIDTALINGGWVIIMTHLRNDEAFYHDDASRGMIIDFCKYAVEKGMLIQTFGEAFQRYKNVLETGTVNNSTYYITDCNGVVRYR